MCQLRFAPSLPAHVYLICSFVLLHIYTAVSVNDVLELLLFPNSFSYTFQLSQFSGFSLCSYPLLVLLLEFYLCKILEFYTSYNEGLQDFSPPLVYCQGTLFEDLAFTIKNQGGRPSGLKGFNQSSPSQNLQALKDLI